MFDHRIDYGSFLADVADSPHEDVVTYLGEQLPYVWQDDYLEMTRRPTQIIQFHLGSFVYIYDDYSTLEERGTVPYDSQAEARLVAVFGRSKPNEAMRDDNRLKGWVGATERMFGAGWDKGHFIAHSMGGAVDRSEVNVFVQRRDLNRGWSRAGKQFREMEQYCERNPGTFCFSRPIYLDGSAKPAFLEFGILKSGCDLWVERFDNRRDAVE